MQKARHRLPHQLSTSLQRLLEGYAIASAAAGLGLVALASSVNAEIVYTPANINIGHDGSSNLDLNNDGIIDFMITEKGGEDGPYDVRNILSARAANGNQVNCPSTFCISSFEYAVALNKGEVIGNIQHKHGWIGGAVQMAFQETFKSGTYGAGGWHNVQDRYLGLKFKIDGAYHYGWARLTVEFDRQQQPRTWEAHLSGYAYETVPGKSIVAGQTQGGVVGETNTSIRTGRGAPRQTSLASLALGADGRAIWRREEQL
jgi:hypothetical protein